TGEITVFDYDDTHHTYTITSGATVQTLAYGPDGKAGTDDDLFVSVDFVDTTGHNMTQALDAQGRVVTITDNTLHTVTTFAYDDTHHTYTITSGTTVQVLGYGLDNKAGTDDDVFLKVNFVAENGDSMTHEIDANGRVTRIVN